LRIQQSNYIPTLLLPSTSLPPPSFSTSPSHAPASFEGTATLQSPYQIASATCDVRAPTFASQSTQLAVFIPLSATLKDY
jgi:hypothetical protein